MFDPGIVLGLNLLFCGMGTITFPSLTLLSGYEGGENEVGHQIFYAQATRSLYSPDSSRRGPVGPVCQGIPKS